jgi:hypothetical protein
MVHATRYHTTSYKLLKYSLTLMDCSDPTADNFCSAALTKEYLAIQLATSVSEPRSDACKQIVRDIRTGTSHYKLTETTPL